MQNVVDANSYAEGRAAARAASDEQLNTAIAEPETKRELSLTVEPSPADKLKALVQECGVPPHKLPELLQEIPPRNLSDKLIDFYFGSV